MTGRASDRETGHLTERRLLPSFRSVLLMIQRDTHTVLLSYSLSVSHDLSSDLEEHFISLPAANYALSPPLSLVVARCLQLLCSLNAIPN